jgi:hypothetical protein
MDQDVCYCAQHHETASKIFDQNFFRLDIHQRIFGLIPLGITRIRISRRCASRRKFQLRHEGFAKHLSQRMTESIPKEGGLRTRDPHKVRCVVAAMTVSLSLARARCPKTSLCEAISALILRSGRLAASRWMDATTARGHPSRRPRCGLLRA